MQTETISSAAELVPAGSQPTPKHQTDYLAVATEWHRRGFFTTPVKPGAKHPRLNGWTKHPTKNLSVAMQHACDYPHDDVGLVSTRGVGHHLWLDIDYHSVEDRILADTGHRLPRTLTTSSRPKTAPWKKHLCYRQTAYSVSVWRTEMSGIRDFTMPKGGDGKVPNLFDVKGVGGGGFVVAGGCWRQTQTDTGVIEEMYTVTDAPIVDVPDWLVDWVIREYRRFRSEDAIRRAAEADLNRAMKATEAGQHVKEFEYDAAKGVLSIEAKGGALIPKEYRNGFIKSLGGELATRGIPKDLTERMLQVAAEVCEPYSDGEKRDKAIQGVVNRLRIGNVWISRKQLRAAETDSDVTGEKSDVTGDEKSVVTGDVTGRPENQLSVLRDAAKGIPWGSDDLPSHLVNSRLRDAAKKAKVFKKENAAWRQAVSRALRGIGAKSKKSRLPSGRLTTYWNMAQPMSSSTATEGDGESGTHSNVVTYVTGDTQYKTPVLGQIGGANDRN